MNRSTPLLELDSATHHCQTVNGTDAWNLIRNLQWQKMKMWIWNTAVKTNCSYSSDPSGTTEIEGGLKPYPPAFSWCSKREGKKPSGGAFPVVMEVVGWSVISVDNDWPRSAMFVALLSDGISTRNIECSCCKAQGQRADRPQPNMRRGIWTWDLRTKNEHVLSALEHKHGLGCGRDHTTPDMMKGRDSKETTEEKTAKVLKAKKERKRQGEEVGKEGRDEICCGAKPSRSSRITNRHGRWQSVRPRSHANPACRVEVSDWRSEIKAGWVGGKNWWSKCRNSRLTDASSRNTRWSHWCGLGSRGWSINVLY